MFTFVSFDLLKKLVFKEITQNEGINKHDISSNLRIPVKAVVNIMDKISKQITKSGNYDLQQNN